MVYSGAFGVAQAERLLWRAGFGPSPARRPSSSLGLKGAIQSLTRPSGAAVLTGPVPNDNGDPLEPLDRYGHDHLSWLDRMVRSNQHLVERMALIFHDWFGLRRDDVGQMDLVMAHIDLFRTQGLGSFRDLLMAVTRDPAMLLFLNGANSDENHPNENYGREVMELFSLGADRGAYTEIDIREAARALTGWRADYVDGTGSTNFHYDPAAHDNRNKTIFGHTGNFDWRDVVDLCIGNPYHRSHFVLKKMWSYFVPVPPDAATQASLREALRRQRLVDPRRRRGDPRPSRHCTAARRWSSRRCSTAPPGARHRQGHRLHGPHVLVRERRPRPVQPRPNVSGWNDNALAGVLGPVRDCRGVDALADGAQQAGAVEHRRF